MQVIDRLLIIILFFLGVFLQTCIEPFNPELNKYKNQLVIYGLITNVEGIHEVKISRTTDANETRENPESGATVSIIDEHENLISLSESSFGIYQTTEYFKGEHNTTYKLLVTTKEGNSYESDFVTLNEVPSISELSSELLEKELDDGKKDYGYQFYVTINEENNSLKYYRWTFEETWELAKPFTVSYFWTGEEKIDVNLSNSCWINNVLNKTIIASTDDYQSNIIEKHPLVYVNNTDGRISTKYCLHVTQYALSEKSYLYWKSVMSNNEEQGSLYDKQPYQLVGNMRSISDPDEVVLGIFEASNISYKRKLVGRAERGIFEGVNFFKDCVLKSNNGKPPKPCYFAEANGVAVYYSIDCVECKTVNGTLNEPVYWDEDNN